MRNIAYFIKWKNADGIFNWKEFGTSSERLRKQIEKNDTELVEVVTNLPYEGRIIVANMYSPFLFYKSDVSNWPYRVRGTNFELVADIPWDMKHPEIMFSRGSMCYIN